MEKGPTARLEVFRVRNDLPTDGLVSINGVVGAAANKSKNNTWGVRTLDFIPESAFVCEITGQYVLGKTVNNQVTCCFRSVFLRVLNSLIVFPFLF